MKTKGQNLDSVAYILFFIISIALFVLIFKQFKKTDKKARPTINTKQDIIDGYERLVLQIVNENKENKDEMLLKKSQVLKSISKDLHNNIYFSDDEAKRIIQELAKI